MTPNNRLRMSALMILLSAIYAVLVAQDPDAASAVAVGYIALLLTAFAFSNIRRKP